LAVDLCSQNYQLLDQKQEETPEFQWLAAHCAEYGFILRYPVGTTEITGIIYEPWHFRYVGETAAREIMEAGITLEEYLEPEDRL
ncbi:MAG: M15 family metallopeptidase, partial [Butyricicoccus sp.]|nr:M15 family metallopeptidase [Butyricicoccus sp.]